MVNYRLHIFYLSNKRINHSQTHGFRIFSNLLDNMHVSILVNHLTYANILHNSWLIYTFTNGRFGSLV